MSRFKYTLPLYAEVGFFFLITISSATNMKNKYYQIQTRPDTAKAVSYCKINWYTQWGHLIYGHEYISVKIEIILAY